jgi:stage III sporulation protein AG
LYLKGVKAVLDEWKRKISDYSEKGVWGSWGKKSRYLVVAVVVCLGLLTIMWPQSTSSPTPPVSSASPAPSSDGVAQAKANLTQELENILSQVDGAGKVQVSITLRSDGLKSYARNTKDDVKETQESGSSSGAGTIKEENQSSDIAVSGGAALLVEDSAPEVVGVLVVAEGAQDSKIKEQLTDATTTLLNISPYQVRVVARKGETQ